MAFAKGTVDGIIDSVDKAVPVADKSVDVIDKAVGVVGKAGDKLQDWFDRGTERSKNMFSKKDDKSGDKSVTTTETTTTVSDGSDDINTHDKVFNLVTSVIKPKEGEDESSDSYNDRVNELTAKICDMLDDGGYDSDYNLTQDEVTNTLKDLKY